MFTLAYHRASLDASHHAHMLTPSPTNPSSPMADEANRREALLRASAHLFREKGYRATTVRDIAAAVGMRSGSPFYHFARKEDILKAIMTQGLTVGLQLIQEALSHAHTPEEEFRALVYTHYHILHRPGSDFVAVMIYEWRHLPEDDKRDVVLLKDRYDGLWHRTLSTLIQQGRLGAMAPIQHAAGEAEKVARLMILGAINYTVSWFKSDPSQAEEWTLEQLCEQTVQFFLRPA